MISVSNSFKKAIKSDNREMYGYVDLKFRYKPTELLVLSEPEKLNMIASNGLITGNKTMQKYATLENNYTLLDGSFKVWNENKILSNGYISNDVFEDIDVPRIIVDNINFNETIRGVTIYFKENLPLEFTVTYTDNNENKFVDTITNNQSYVYQYVFDNERNIIEVELNIIRIEHPKNRIRIALLDYNVGDLYEGDELISFDVDEELDLLAESLPINTCTINLNNYPDSHGGNKFDPINPKGIVKYLDDNVTLEPYIGVLTEDNGVEYVKMGTYYLTDWSSNSNGNVTLTGGSVLSKLQSMTIPDTGGFFALTTPSDVSAYLSQNTDYKMDFMDSNYAFSHNKLEISNLMEYIKLLITFNSAYKSNDTYSFRKFFVNRYNTVRLDSLNLNSVDSIPRNLLKTDVDYTTRNKINELTIKYKSISLMSDTERKQLIDDTHTLFNTEEYVWYKINDHHIWDENPSFSYSVVSGSGIATLVDKNLYFMVVKYTGTVGSKIAVSYTNRIQKETKNIVESTVALSDKKGDNIAIDVSQFGYFYPEYLELVQNYYKGMDKNYQIRATTMGDPSLVIGDTISVQTRYTDINNGYKDIIITKQKFTFDGGLQCELEGVGD